MDLLLAVDSTSRLNDTVFMNWTSFERLFSSFDKIFMDFSEDCYWFLIDDILR